MNKKCELLVIGGGKAGKTLAIDYAKAGKKVIMVEQSFIGGTCINVGCIPTKALIASSNLVSGIKELEQIVNLDSWMLDWSKIKLRKDLIVQSMIKMNHDLFVNSGIDFIMGSAKFINNYTVEVTPNNSKDKELITADEIIINTGATPFIPVIPGLDKVEYLTSESVMNIDTLPEKLIIIGGGYIGLEFGQMFNRLGVKVTILERSNQFIPLEDRDIADEIYKILTEEGLEIILGCESISLDNKNNRIQAHVTAPDKNVIVEGDRLLLAIGRTPQTKNLGLEKTGVLLDERGFIKVNQYLCTDVKHIWAVGDVKGGAQFTHVSLDDYRIVKHNIMNPEHMHSIDLRLIPYTVFIEPELGRIGINEVQAAKANIDIKVVKLAVNNIPRARTLGVKHGLLKAYIEPKTGLILGASILCIHGGEIMGAIQIAMMGKLPYHVLKDGMFAHPTLIEGFNQLFANIE